MAFPCIRSKPNVPPLLPALRRSTARGGPSAALSLVAALLLCVVSLAACASHGPRRPERPLHEQYRPLLGAVQDALAREDLALAERTLLQWRGRVQADRPYAVGAAAAFAEGGEPPNPLRPGPEDLATAEWTIDGLERVVLGRRVAKDLTLELALERVPGQQVARVHLRVASRRTEPLELRPGPASLELRRCSLEPLTGHETHMTDFVPLPTEMKLRIPPGGSVDFPMTEVTLSVPSGAIATRLRCSLVLRAGIALLDGREVPLRSLAAAEAERTDFPGWLPATPLEPSELLRVLTDGSASPALLAECAVRILPARRTEALELIREPALLRPKDEFGPVVTVVRWLAGAEDFGRDPGTWRQYLDAAPWRTGDAP